MPSWVPRWDDVPPALLEFWTERHLCMLTTLRPDGRPHLVPVGVALDLEQQCAWVITRGGSRKAANLRDAGPGALVSAGAVDGGRWSTLEGRARVTEDPAEIERACDRYASRYRTPQPNPERVAIRIEIDRFLASAGLLARA
ncbi:pyridoxamine 5'-phosphate oxidase family protein [Nocardioides sp. R-C-SC26]|uniref:pyridoxamine 5'-phosphate oxidase family protein n=1 Tax=Nocardioides sp. R-C-SC26 TaxID=2870414 RepID=UPI001E5AC334|nr:PPOX class F420-dependent oxidoreductase [Nocardioides sp. R-C-SC26]